jgi:hypothetical protein
VCWGEIAGTGTQVRRAIRTYCESAAKLQTLGNDNKLSDFIHRDIKSRLRPEIPATVWFIIFYPAFCYLKIRRLNCTQVYVCVFHVGKKLGLSC